MTYFKNNWLLQWAVVGVLLGVGFVFPLLWIGGIIGIAFAVHLTLQSTSYKKRVVGSALAWTIKSALALVWFWSVYPLDWIGIDSAVLQIILIFLWWITAATWLGLGGVAFAVVCKFVQQHTPSLVLYSAIPFVWILSEMFGSLLFSIITIGPGGVVTTAFSFGYVGYLLADHGLFVQGAQIAGVYALGVAIVGISLLTLRLHSKEKKYRSYVYVFLALVYASSLVSLPTVGNVDDGYTVAVVDTDFSLQQLRTKEGREKVHDQLESAVQAAQQLEPDYILLPEDSRYFNQQVKADTEAAQFAFRSTHSDVIIVDSGRADNDGKAVVQSFIYNGQSQVVDQSHKRYLVPQGEFMPSLYAVGLKLFNTDEVIDRFANNTAFEVGSKTSQADYDASSPGVLFCFESVSPWGVRTVMQERGSVSFIAHPVSHAWFNEPQALWSQINSMLRVQAIWNQQYIVSSGNAVQSRVFTPSGEVTSPTLVTTEDGWRLSVTKIPK